MIAKSISVNDNYWRSSKRSKFSFGQMELPLDGALSPNLSIHVVALEAMHGSDFIRTLRQVHPKAVFDLREVGRFNMPGASRQSVFGELRRLESRYIEAPMPWSDMNLREYSSNFVNTASRLRSFVKQEGSPSIFIVSNDSQRDFTLRLLLANSK
ncbi:hypothetical protein N0B44_08455 [Roseibacterium beibuensis]|uniref:hypothetical protein n=1 Tax=[Roseibacterium] beibuensis TaxID=1193142 RepID=UPI00217E426F|nr:hypothetical protein [Roseibacterium beibuensis]MCS6622937.1 hypothetical protein [Roseibacterium beibuensis]